MLYRATTIPRLDLDLEPRSLAVFASGPLQAQAKTPDGDDIEIRYDCGRLRIQRRHDGVTTIVVDCQIGPPSHGDILLRQIHEMTGLTVGGKPPEPHHERRANTPLTHIRPLGVNEIVWEQPLTLGGEDAANYVASICRAIPGVVALQTHWDRMPSKPWTMRLAEAQDPARSASPLILIPRANDAEIKTLLAQTAITPGDIDVKCPNNIRITHRWDSVHLRRDADCKSEQLSARIGRPITLHEAPSTIISARVDMADETAKNDALTLARLTAATFGKTYEPVDLKTGRISGERFEAPRWYLPGVARWANSGTDRYLTVSEQDGEIIGYRPVQTEI